ncbi:MAG: heme exporter protein CcmB [Anaerolineae bacterium]|nr:heme exporter protein CcmB [Anaerolineae bacterium]
MRRTPFLRAVFAIAAKDLQAEFRSRLLISAMGLFAVLTVMVFYYTLESRPEARRGALPGALWVTVTFAGTLGIGRSLAAEYDRGTLDGLVLAPVPRSALYFGKLAIAWLFTLTVALVVTLALSIVFNTNLLRLGWLLIAFLGTLGFAAIGTLLGSMAVYARSRETTLPILVLPVALPIIIASVNAAHGVLDDQPLGEWIAYPLLLASVSAVFLTLAYLLFDYVLEE